tara:strand:+ start:4552 stop:4725 length:174 start_codon:yes stop_codon:yes gene_type:complete
MAIPLPIPFSMSIPLLFPSPNDIKDDHQDRQNDIYRYIKYTGEIDGAIVIWVACPYW